MDDYLRRNCLQFEPWYGDDSDYRLFRDKIVTSRKDHVCNTCRNETSAGDVVRARTESFEGEIKTFYFCTSCCIAQAISSEDNGVYLDYRTGLGMQKAA